MKFASGVVLAGILLPVLSWAFMVMRDIVGLESWSATVVTVVLAVSVSLIITVVRKFIRNNTTSRLNH